MLLFLQKNKKTIQTVGLLFIGILPVLFAVFHKGFFVTDDGSWMIIRLSAFYEALRSGEFPVRYLPRLANGYGYPVVDFLYPLYLYIGAGIHILHINFIMTIKLLFLFSFIASGLGSFFWFKKYFGIVAALVGSLVYTLFPYHVWDMSKRGSLGEILAMAIAPYIFWQIEKASIGLTALGIGLLIVSHNTLALLFLPIVIAYMLLVWRIRQLFYSVTLGLGLSAFFWLPALYDQRYTIFGKTIVSDYNQYFLMSQLYPLIGILSFVVLLLSLIIVLKKKESKFIFFLVVSLLSLSFTNKISQPIWQFLQLGKYIQFPFRFLSITTLGVGFLSAYLVKNFQSTKKIIIGGIILLLLYTSSWSFFFPREYTYYPDSYYSTNQDTTTVHNEYMPIWVKKLPVGYQQRVYSTSPASVSSMIDKKVSLSFQMASIYGTSVTISTIYFPGWTAFIDGKKTAIKPTNQGFISFSISPGKHHILARFEETPLHLVSDILSLVSILILLAILFHSMLRLKQKK